jgi:hypothetical protein
MTPEPASNSFNGSGIEYLFNGREGAEITFHLVPKDFGSVKGSVIVNEEVFGLNHFIFP